MAFCGNCGTEISDGVKFCPECGAKIIGNGAKNCAKCGNKLEEGAKFCPKCGTSTESKKSKKSNKKLIPYIFGALIIVLVALGGWLLGNRPGKDYSLEGLAKAAVKYDYIGDFCEGFAMVRKGEKIGYIDKMGNEVIPCIYDEIIPTSDDIMLENNDYLFHDGLVFVCKDNNYFFIDTEGKEAFPFKYESAQNFSEGFAVVCKGNKYGYIDTKGNEVIPLTSEFVYGKFYEGLAAVVKDGKYGYIDKSGKIVIPIQFDGDYYTSHFCEGLAVVEKNEKYGYIDTKGNEVISCKFEWACDFSDGLAIVRKNGKGGYIDKTGREVIPCAFDETDDFSEGLALVSKDGKKFYINKEGKEAFPSSYDYISSFYEGLAQVKKGNLYGFIDKSGKEIIPCLYSFVSSFSGGLASVNKDGISGYVDKKGNSTFDIQDEEVKKVVDAKIQEKEEARREEERRAEEERKRIEEENKPSNKFYQVANQGCYVWQCVNGYFIDVNQYFYWRPNRLFLYFYPSSKQGGKVTVATYYTHNNAFISQFTNKVSYSVIDDNILFTYRNPLIDYTVEYRLRIENNNGNIRLVRSDGQTYVQSSIDISDPL